MKSATVALPDIGAATAPLPLLATSLSIWVAPRQPIPAAPATTITASITAAGFQRARSS